MCWKGLLGRKLKPSELSGGLDVEALIGKECRVMVLQAKSRNGATYSNVERIFPLSGRRLSR